LEGNYTPLLIDFCYKKLEEEAEMNREQVNSFYGSELKLTDNIYIINDTLCFQYQPYEVAPFSLGAPIIKVPFKNIKSFIKKDGIIRRILMNNKVKLSD